jgi:sterol desaturase/sphingolipid hydroxylase (fatty acid hydroxylase superfamily)
MVRDAVQWVLERTAEYAFSALSSWDGFAAALAELAGTFTRMSSGLAWPYLLASTVIAGAAFRFSQHPVGVNPASFVAYLFPRHIYRHSSALLDCRFYVVNAFLTVLLWTPMLAGVGALAEKLVKALWLGSEAWVPPPSPSPVYLFCTVLGFFLLNDFGNYIAHVLLHKVPVLWSFHQVHHSAEVLTPVTAFRVHPIEFFVSAVVRLPVIGWMVIFYQNVSPHDLAITTAFGVSIAGLLYGFSGFHLQHSHLPISYGPVLDRILVSPVIHQAHHSIDPKHRDKNFGVKFSMWDGLFGTLFLPKTQEPLRFGVSGLDSREFATVGNLYCRPVRRVLGRLRLSLAFNESPVLAAPESRERLFIQERR